jgi:alkylated DNA repair dioxygenase AlkB
MTDIMPQEDISTTKGHTVMPKEWCVMMDDARVILFIQALIHTKIANKCIINIYSHSDFTANI